MGKKVEAKIKLQIKMCQANPAPPVGPALGQRGVNIPEFCKGFNAKTQEMINEHDKARKDGELKIYEPGMVVPVEISVYSDRSFSFEVKTPPATALLKKVINLAKGSSTPHTNKVGKVTRSQLEQIARAKEPDLTAADLEAAIRTIAGSARSMGLEVEGVVSAA